MRLARYTFGEYVLSPTRRLLLRSGREIPLVPRYFDLLLLLVRRREEAVSRGEIFESVWSDVVVSDGALSQAVRTLRRALGDDPRRSLYIRTVSRHGYQFVYREVVESDDTLPLALAGEGPPPEADRPADDFETALSTLMSDSPEDVRREAAETLHALDTRGAVSRIRGIPRSAGGRALLRDARWDLPQAGPVPILGEPDALGTVRALLALRLGRVLRAAGSRYAAAVAGATIAGLVAGLVGGILLYLGPASSATAIVLGALPVVGGLIAAVGAAGVAAGLCWAEVTSRSWRGSALVVLGAAGGGGAGFVAHALGRMVLEGLFGQDLSPVAGGLEGLALGGATGLGYALATPRAGGGLATPRGGARWLAVLAAGCACAIAAALLSAGGSYLGAMSLDLLAHRFPGAQVGLEPLASILGETGPGPVTRVVIGAWEGLMFGSGTVLGLTHRPE